MNRLPVIVIIVLVLIFTTFSMACGNTVNNEETDDADELFDAFLNYALECKWAQEIAIERLNKTSELVLDGEIAPLECRKRFYQITLIHAYTLDYIDSKREYKILWPMVYASSDAPKLAWAIPELEQDYEAKEAEYESYLTDYIDHHYFAISEVVRIIGPPKTDE